MLTSTARYLLLSFSFALLLSRLAVAQEQRILNLKTGAATLNGNWAANAKQAGGAPQGRQLIIVELGRQLQPGERESLASQGVTVGDAFGGSVYSILLENGAAQSALLRGPGVKSASPFQPAWKIDPATQETGGNTNTQVVLALMPGVKPQDIKAILQEQGGVLKSQDLLPEGLIELSIPASKLYSIAALPEVRSIGPASQRVPLNQDQRGYSGAAQLEQPLSSGGKGLNGSGVTVGVGDNTHALTHIDTRDRDLNFNPAPTSNHGIHVTGTVGGAGIVDPRARGMAPRAFMLSHLYDLIWAKTPELRQGYNMTLSNNSYAAQVGNCAYAGVYDAYSAALDDYAVRFPDVLHVFASGNDGNLQCAPFNNGYGNVTGGYQPAKNNIVVGNAEKPLNVRSGSSKGPVKDGRLKPEICAFGTDVFSCKPFDTYQPATGTSMASPAVTGALALLSQRWKELKGGVNPPGIVIKGLLLNNADDLGEAGPDYAYGFGMFNLRKAVAALEEGRYQTGSVSTGATQTYTVTVPSGTTQLKVFLTWHDVPASATASKALVNDLDLQVSEPGGTVHNPLILNPAIPTAVAAEGIDRLNNAEQVVINTPAPGTYTVTVTGFAVTGAQQSYVMTYDAVADGVRLLSPTVGVPVAAGSNYNIYWEASPGNASFSIEFSSDNGSSWTSIGTATSTQRYMSWTVPNISTSQARVRVTRGGQSSTSGPFVVNAIPAVQLASAQCPGYVVISWNAISNATGYELLRKVGYDLVPVDTITATTYAFSGLPLDTEQYVAVRPLINGVGGYRSNAVMRIPNTGTSCGTVANGDLLLERIVTPLTGRQFTSTSLSASQNINVQVRNLGTAVIGSYQAFIRVAGGAWTSSAIQSNLGAGATSTISFPNINLSSPGAYSVELAVRNTSSTDPNRRNDSGKVVARQLANPVVDVTAGPVESFESVPRLFLFRDSIGLFQDTRWDFMRTGTLYGRLRTFVDSTVTLAGSQSLSLDADRNNAGTTNSLSGTFNLTGQNAASDEIRMEFEYRLHGRPKFPAANNVLVRGTDVSGWVPLFTFDTSLSTGARYRSGSLSVSDAMLTSNQSFSSSTGIQFNQSDTSVIAARDYGNGLTIDNIRLYRVVNDVALLGIDTPIAAACNLASPVPLRVRVANGTRIGQNNIPIAYRLDGGPVQQSLIASLAPKDTIFFTFPQLLNAAAPGQHILDVWVAQAGDTYAGNDSILRYAFRNQPLIDSFPYLENFEASEGNWFPSGRNASWAWGQPAGTNIRMAASGTKAWKTGLTRGYFDNEKSHLNSPCFDVSRLTSPMLSFSLAYDIENCGTTLCDAAWVEWTTDGNNWTKLGIAGDGYSWYDSVRYQAWTTEQQTRWRVATIPLPRVQGALRLRFVMQSDPGSVKEGIAIDDIHIYDKGAPVSGGVDALAARTVPASAAEVFFDANNGRLAAISPTNNALGNVTVTVSDHQPFIDSSTGRYLLPRSFVIQSEKPVEDSVFVKLYVSDNDVLRMLADTGCPQCSRAADVYRLGVLKYDDIDERLEDATMSNNLTGLYRFKKYSDIAWVPYDAGYYARFPVSGFSEFWFTDGGSESAFPPAEAAVQFNARRIDRSTVRLDWKSFVDTLVVGYEVQRAINNRGTFETIAAQNPQHLSPQANYSAEDKPTLSTGDSVFYRLKWRQLDGTIFYSGVRRISWNAENTVSIFPNPVTGGQFTIRYAANPGSQLGITLADVSGRVVFRQSFAAGGWDNTETISLSLPAGLYFLRGELNGNRLVEKLIFR